MKKALLTVLVVLIAVGSAFATFNYGLDVTGVYNTYLADEHGQTLEMTFKPYVSGEKYKVQLVADWDVDKGFAPLKNQKINNCYDFAETLLSYIDNAHFNFTDETGLGIVRVKDYDYYPFVYFETSNSVFSFDYKTTVVDDGEDYEYLIPMDADFSAIISQRFPLQLKASADYGLFVNSKDTAHLHSVMPTVGVSIPLTINNHGFSVDFDYSTPFEISYADGEYTVEKDAFENWELASVIETSINHLTLDLSAAISKEADEVGILTLGLDAEYERGNFDLAVGGSIPYALNDNWAIIEKNRMSEDNLYASVSYGKKFYIGADLSVNGLAKALTDDSLTRKQFVEPVNEYVAFTAYAGLDTKPFDLKVSTKLKNVEKFDSEVTMTFTVNTENFLSK